MYQKILVATDGSAGSEKAVNHAAQLATALRADLSIVTVAERPAAFINPQMPYGITPDVHTTIQESITETGRRILDVASRKATEYGVNANAILVENLPPYEGILQTAKDINADLIIMSSHSNQGVLRALLGSQANKVVCLSDRSVLIVK